MRVAACHDVEPVDSYLTDCMYDVCACAENMQDCLCPTLGIYADTCAAKGVKLSWRQQISECSKSTSTDCDSVSGSESDSVSGSDFDSVFADSVSDSDSVFDS